MLKPSSEEITHCIDIRKRGKRGEHLTKEETAFCTKIYKRFPDWYAKTEARVFNETVPFGSNAHRPESEEQDGTER